MHGAHAQGPKHACVGAHQLGLLAQDGAVQADLIEHSPRGLLARGRLRADRHQQGVHQRLRSSRSPSDPAKAGRGSQLRTPHQSMGMWTRVCPSGLAGAHQHACGSRAWRLCWRDPASLGRMRQPAAGAGRVLAPARGPSAAQHSPSMHRLQAFCPGSCPACTWQWRALQGKRAVQRQRAQRAQHAQRAHLRVGAADAHEQHVDQPPHARLAGVDPGNHLRAPGGPHVSDSATPELQRGSWQPRERTTPPHVRCHAAG